MTEIPVQAEGNKELIQNIQTNTGTTETLSLMSQPQNQVPDPIIVNNLADFVGEHYSHWTLSDHLLVSRH